MLKVVATNQEMALVMFVLNALFYICSIMCKSYIEVCIICNFISYRIKSQQGIVTEDIETELITSSVAMHYWEF